MIDILMPRLSDTMTEGAIATWLKKPGDAVAPGDLLVEIETDKALMEQEAYDAGILVEILVAEGENVPIGTPIARLDDGSGESTGPADAPREEPEPRAASAVPASVPAPSAEPVTPTGRTHERRAATPLVRRLARERGVDLDGVVGSGPGGRIVRADLDAAADSAPGTPVATAADERDRADARDSEVVPFDGIRQQIAARLTESATTVPSFTATAAADVTALLALRTEVNAQLSDERVSVNDLVVRAVAQSLRAHPDVNSSYDGEGRGRMLRHGRVHIGIAVASPAGLVVPVIRDADRAAVTTLARTSRELVAKAADRRLTTADMADGTFTVSNLGMYGIEEFTAIINPPQGAILAVGAVRDELALDGDGAVTARRMLRLTLTADHRIIDGALAAQFLATLTGILEHPLRVVA
ncbi:dihydrolipoamide acetyltransferase family protein [Streptomyces sp. AC495_CC817]|uniref:dihydrolipoamide acetyltransferase family protein n=1 Tax=Streptomyces sp. AC495_CC817 TaxID=2823900 RepID=UPI001C279778|nr:dihydrolipoamide acetyltransferase family protein [Streptomyces sp. AC495_CC817]